jgi:hypothetical protein
MQKIILTLLVPGHLQFKEDVVCEAISEIVLKHFDEGDLCYIKIQKARISKKTGEKKTEKSNQSCLYCENIDLARGTFSSIQSDLEKNSVLKNSSLGKIMLTDSF